MKHLVLVLGIATLAYGYPNGTMPTNANVIDVLAQYERYKKRYISTSGCPNPSTMLRVLRDEGHSNGEFQGYGLQFASMLEADDEVAKKLWAYAEHFLNDHGLMPWDISASGEVLGKGAAADGCMDISMGLDRAAFRWGGKFDAAATTYVKNMAWQLTNYSGKERCRQRVLVGAINGDGCGHYLNYIAFAHFPRLHARDAGAGWTGSVLTKCWSLFKDTYKLPPWYVIKDGTIAKPNDPWGTPGNRWDGGATRTAWRIGTRALVSDDANAQKWAQKIVDVFNAGGADENILKVSGSYNPVSGESRNWGATPLTMSGAGVCGMAVGDRHLVDGAWDFLARYRIPQKGMADAMCVMGLSIMAGLFSYNEQVSDPTTRITAPDNPRNVTISPYTSTSMKISWEKVEQTFGYIIEQKTGGSWERIDDVNRNENMVIVPNLQPSTTYEFRVSTYTSKGESEPVVVSAQTSAPASGEVVYAVNCGGPQYLGSDGTFYRADEHFLSGRGNPRFFDIEGTDDDIVYSSERFGSFSYSIPVENDDYRVILLFAESFWTEPAKRISNVSVEGKNFAGLDIVAEVGTRTALQKEAEVSISDGKVDVSVQTVLDNGTLQGIVIRRLGQTGLRTPGLRPLRTDMTHEGSRVFSCRGRLIPGGVSATRNHGVYISAKDGHIQKRISIRNR